MQLNNYEQWQLEKYGDIVPDTDHTPNDQLEESAFEEMNRLAEWMAVNAERQMWERENYLP